MLTVSKLLKWQNILQEKQVTKTPVNLNVPLMQSEHGDLCFLEQGLEWTPHTVRSRSMSSWQGIEKL